jgi:hypothetical protein
MSDFWRVFFLLTAGGVIGGLLYRTSIFLSTTHKITQNPLSDEQSTISFSIANAFMGIGGAWVVLLVLLLTKRAPLGLETDQLLELFATAMVAGYTGNRIFLAGAGKLTKELFESTAKKVNNAEKSANRSRVISEVLAYLDQGGNQTGHQTRNFVAALQAQLKLNPEFREIAILLARVLAELKNDKRSAIYVLQGFIATKRRSGKEDDENVADAFWNLANYFEEDFKKTGDRDSRQEAISAMGESLRILPDYRANYIEDGDFKDLRNDAKAKKLLYLAPQKAS